MLNIIYFLNVYRNSHWAHIRWNPFSLISVQSNTILRDDDEAVIDSSIKFTFQILAVRPVQSPIGECQRLVGSECL